ncbi:MAG: hypothetical protein MJ131_05585 [Lachnospiraceae bacterium]|nr:hypothetical protein [Lachnospiraceae bacterium]
MQSRTSLFDKTILKKNILKSWPLWAAYSLILFCIISVGLMLESSSFLTSYDYPKDIRIIEYIYSAASELRLLSFAVCIVVALVQFSYLHNSRATVFFHSLPVNRKRLFATNYLSSALIVFVPNLVFYFVGILQAMAEGASAVKPMSIWLLTICIEEFMFLALAIFMIMLSGQSITAAVMYILGSFIFWAIYALVDFILEFVCYGYKGSQIPQIIECLSPMFILDRINANVIGALDKFSADSSIYSMTKDMLMNNYIIPVSVAFATGIVLSVLAYILYKKRRNETVGDVISGKRLKHVFAYLFAVLFTIFMTAFVLELYFERFRMSSKIAVVICVAVFGIIGYYIARMILEKSFRVIKKYAVSAFVYTGVMIVFAIVLVTSGFGIRNRIPDAEDIERINCYANGEKISYENEKCFEGIRKIHQAILECEEAGDDVYYDYNVELFYFLKDGSQISRFYYMKHDTANDMAAENLLRDYYNKNRADIILGGNPDYYEMAQVNNCNYEQLFTVDKSDMLRLYNTIHEDIESGDAVLPAGFVFKDNEPGIVINSADFDSSSLPAAEYDMPAAEYEIPIETENVFVSSYNPNSLVIVFSPQFTNYEAGLESREVVVDESYKRTLMLLEELIIKYLQK